MIYYAIIRCFMEGFMLKNMVRKIYWLVYDAKVFFCNFFARLQVKEMGKGCKFHKFCKLTPRVKIGNNCHFNGIRIQGAGNVVIGNNFHSGMNVLFISADHNYDGGNALPYDNTYISGDIIIDDNVWIGSNVIILKNVHLGEGCIIQAGSVVTKDIPPLAIAGGHPAKAFKYRDVEHYNKLKSEK